MLGFHALSEAPLSSLITVVTANPFSVDFTLPNLWLRDVLSSNVCNVSSILNINQSNVSNVDNLIGLTMININVMENLLSFIHNSIPKNIEILSNIKSDFATSLINLANFISTSDINVAHGSIYEKGLLFNVNNLISIDQNLTNAVERLLTFSSFLIKDIDYDGTIYETVVRNFDLNLDSLQGIFINDHFSLSNLLNSYRDYLNNIGSLVNVTGNKEFAINNDATFEAAFSQPVSFLLSLVLNFSKVWESQGTPPQEIFKDFIFNTERMISFAESDASNLDFSSGLLTVLPYNIESIGRISFGNGVGVNHLLRLENNTVHPIENLHGLFSSLRVSFDFYEGIRNVIVLNLESISPFEINSEFSFANSRDVSLSTIVSIVNQLNLYKDSLLDVEYDGILAVTQVEAFLIWRLHDETSWRLTK